MEHTENKTIIHDTEKTASWEQQTAMKVSGISILVNLLLSVFKLIAGIVAHSGAMISDAIHSASDVFSTVIVMIGVHISGNVHLGAGCEMGVGSSIIQGLSVGEESIVGAGAAVVRNIPAHCTAVGVPAKPIRYHAKQI